MVEKERRNPEQLEIVIQRTVHTTLTSLGFTIDDPNAVQRDMAYLRKARNGSEEVATWVKRSVIGVGVSGVLFALWNGIKHSMNG